MYKIFLDDNKEAKLVIHLNSIPLLRVPAQVLVGVGNIKSRYKNWLKKAVNDNQEILHMLCRVHLEAVKNGSVALLTYSKLRGFHGVVIKEYLEENTDFLNTATPYVFPKEEMPEAIKKLAPMQTGGIPVDFEADVMAEKDPNRKIQNSTLSGRHYAGEFDTAALRVPSNMGKTTGLTLDDLAGIIGEDGAKQIREQIEKDQASHSPEAQ